MKLKQERSLAWRGKLCVGMLFAIACRRVRCKKIKKKHIFVPLLKRKWIGDDYNISGCKERCMEDL